MGSSLSGLVTSLHWPSSGWSKRLSFTQGEHGVGCSIGVGATTTPPSNSTVGGVSVLDVRAGESPHWLSQRARGEGRGLAKKSRVLGRSGWQRRRGVGGKTRFGSGRRGTSVGSSLTTHGFTVCSCVGLGGNGCTLFCVLLFIAPPFFMAPSDGVRCSLRVALGTAGTCVGVRDWRGLRLKLSM